MNKIEHTPYIWEKRKWYFISIFYAREKWGELTSETLRFYKERKNMFEVCLISFSREKGENIQVTFITPEDNNNNYSNEIQVYFQSFIDRNPSISKQIFPYGEVVWCNYSNNSLTWDIFKSTYYSDQYIYFYQKTLDVVLKLANDDFSENNFFSIAMYMITKGLFCINKCEQKNALLQIIYTISKEIKNNLKVNNWVKEQVNKYDFDKVFDVIVSYKNEGENEYSEELMIWLNEVKTFMKTGDYQFLYFVICRICGLTPSRQLVILSLLNKWFEWKR